MAELVLNALQKSYGTHRILNGITLTVPSGQFVSLLGPSGSGKTTALRCIAGLERPDTGEVRIGGELLSSADAFVPPEKRGLGMVFQNYAVWPHLDVFENVAFPLRVKKATEVEGPVNEALRQVRLEGLGKRFPHELSGGQQQRVALARALVMRPKILLLDEPLSNLDAILREELGAQIRELQLGLGLTTVLVTHDQKEALSLSDRIVVLHQGKVEADGEPETLYRQPPTDFVSVFFAGGQEIGGKVYLPRRWSEGSGQEFEIVGRVYLGNEYEYAARGSFSEPVRFYSAKKHEHGAKVQLKYTP